MKTKNKYSREYLEMLDSPRTKLLKEIKFIDQEGKCASCNYYEHERGGLDLHHLHYDTLGHEDLKDVELLCRRCHNEADAARKHATERARYMVRVYAWMDKVHGECWEDLYNLEDACDLFEEWLASKGEEA